MKHSPRAVRLMACGIAVIFIAAGSGPTVLADEAAGFGKAASGASANEVAEFKGKLKGFQRGVLQVTKEDGTDVMVQLPATAAGFTFVADAKIPFLTRGMLVRFSGTFAPNGAAAVPIDKVEIFQPINLQGIPGHSRDRFVPGVHPADKRAAKKPVGLGKYTIVGSLVGINGNGAIRVQAGKIPVVAPLAQDATFQIRFNNLNLAKEGDTVSVAGFYNPPDETRIRGEVITITTDRVYGEPSEVPQRRSRRTSKRASKKADAESPATSEPADPLEDSAKS
ncbi:hypothetical protein [Planctomycetes bacterium K23_9]|uniref:hypothetical protein n=1 Tax=Stieleria marina TaxID=1930275 RepID=UPI0011AADC92